MMKLNRFGIASLVLVGMAVGCTGKKDALSLEEQNRNLAGQIGDCETALRAAQSDRDTLLARLNEANRDLESLRGQLASAPTPSEAAPGWTAVPGGAMIAIEDDILFESGRAVLRDKARGRLNSIVSTLKGEYGDKDVLVFGHTDNQPIKKSGWADNLELGSQRSLAVTRYLRDNGISPRRLIPSSAGEYRPRANNSSDKGRAANRRVEIYAIDLAALRD
jgi:flagellar motor protein MotB